MNLYLKFWWGRCIPDDSVVSTSFIPARHWMSGLLKLHEHADVGAAMIPWSTTSLYQVTDAVLQGAPIIYGICLNGWLTEWFWEDLLFILMHEGSSASLVQLIPWLIMIWSPFYWHETHLIPAWISNHTYSKMTDKITYPSINFNGITVEEFKSITGLISHFIMDVITYSCWGPS